MKKITGHRVPCCVSEVDELFAVAQTRHFTSKCLRYLRLKWSNIRNVTQAVFGQHDCQHIQGPWQKCDSFNICVCYKTQWSKKQQEGLSWKRLRCFTYKNSEETKKTCPQQKQEVKTPLTQTESCFYIHLSELQLPQTDSPVAQVLSMLSPSPRTSQVCTHQLSSLLNYT